MGFGFEKINVNPSSDSAPFAYLKSDIPNRAARKARNPELFVHRIGVNGHRIKRNLRVWTKSPA
jgi:hypothetical protein